MTQQEGGTLPDAAADSIEAAEAPQYIRGVPEREKRFGEI